MKKSLTLSNFKKIVNDKITPNTSFLLAVSGGLDSMVLLELFQLSKLKFHVAHVNYGLRGISSNYDMELVKKVCNRKKIMLHIKKIQPYEFDRNKFSIQMIARKIRYDFFKDLLNLHSLQIIVTAHHQDDQIERFFINLFRGSGLKGLSLMKIVDNFIFRPLLNYSKSQLLEFAQKENISWREDQTNQLNIYLRNKIRNKLIPVIEAIHPTYKTSIQKSMFLIEDCQKILEKIFLKKEEKILKKIDFKSDTYFYLLNKVKKLPLTFLYFLFSKFEGIPLNEIQKFLYSSLGTNFSNDKFTFWLDYKYLIIEPNNCKSIDFDEFILTTCNFYLTNPLNIKGKCLDFVDSCAQFWLDADKLQFPLKIRKWNLEDIIYPINMIKSKKVSKYLKEKKISKYFKNKIYVLVDNLNNIICIVGYVIDNRFKVYAQTKKILNIWVY